jgi:hypothetical protein
MPRADDEAGAMDAPANATKAADRFASVAEQFCLIVESVSNLEKTDLILGIYRTLPTLIAQAIELPEIKSSDDDDSPNDHESNVNIRLNDDQWRQLYEAIKEKLADWDAYMQVFDPTTDNEALHGSLADDAADIYRDLKEGLVLRQTHRARDEDIVWK